MNDQNQLMLIQIEEPDQGRRPRRRGECHELRKLVDEGGNETGEIGPCPWATCVWHVATLRRDAKGKRLHPGEVLDVTELAETCVLDVADRGGDTLEFVGALIGVTRERTRQIEGKARIGLTMAAPRLADAIFGTGRGEAVDIDYAIRRAHGLGLWPGHIARYLQALTRREWTPRDVEVRLLEMGCKAEASQPLVRERIVARLRVVGQASTSDLIEYLGVTGNYVRKELVTLREAGVVSTTVPSSRRCPRLHRLVEARR